MPQKTSDFPPGVLANVSFFPRGRMVGARRAARPFSRRQHLSAYEVSLEDGPPLGATLACSTHPDHLDHLKKEKRGRVAVRAFSLFRREPHATPQAPCNASLQH